MSIKIALLYSDKTPLAYLEVDNIVMKKPLQSDNYIIEFAFKFTDTMSWHTLHLYKHMVEKGCLCEIDIFPNMVDNKLLNFQFDGNHWIQLNNT